jgi:hypothetical protein
VLVAGVVAALAVAGALFVVVGSDQGDDAPAASDTTLPEPPPTWDERVLHLVEFVEAERGLRFDHAVHIDFLDEQEWEEQADIDEEELLDEDVQLLEHGEGLFRAIGLAEGDLDLLDDSETLGASGTVGLYQFDEERITVRGKELSAKVEATLVHELTHALQDQHFDIGDRLERVAEEDTDEESLRVLVEGDASRIEDRWVEELPEARRQVLEDERAEESTTAEEALSELPQSLVTFFASSYILGDGLMAILEADGGQRAIDDAFDAPPGPEEHVFDPIAFLEGDDAADVDLPTVVGEPLEDLEGEFGAVGWYLMLAERIDPVTALAALESWGGDAVRPYRDGEQTCAAMRFVGETANGNRRMADALDVWAAAMPEAAAVEVHRLDERVDVITCDPGPDADTVPGDGRSRETIGLIALRTELASQVLESGGTHEQARCFSRRVIAALDYELLSAPAPTPEQQQEIQRVATEQAAGCR